MTAKENAVFDFWNSLERIGIEWLILRNYGQRQLVKGRDVDLFMRFEDVPRAIKLLIVCSKRFGGSVLHFYRRHHLIALYIRFPEEEKPLHVDFYHGAFSWAGIEYLSHDQVLKSRRQYCGLPIPAPEHEAAVLTLASLLDGGFVNKRYLPRVRMLLDSRVALDVFENDLRPVFGKQALGQLRDLALGSGSFDRSDELALAKLLRNALVLRSVRASPMATSLGFVKWCWSEMRRFASPSGPVVVITGPDGSGKSTVIAAIRERLGEWIGVGRVFHWRPGLLSDAGRVGRRHYECRAKVHSEPHSKGSHGFVLSALRLGYYLTDYWLGYLVLVRRDLARNRVVFFDRYAVDMEVDPKRFRFRLPKWLLSLPGAVVPRPNLVIALIAPGEILVARKPELSVAVADQLSKLYLAAVARFENGQVQDASLPKNVVVEQVYQLVLDAMMQSAATRLAGLGMDGGSVRER